MTIQPFAVAPVMGLLAATPDAGFALQNGTPVILSWTAPDDGQLHRVSAICSIVISAAETGGVVAWEFTAPDGTAAGYDVSTGGQGTGWDYSSAAAHPAVIKAGSTATLTQTSALTAGAAKIWAEIWGS